ncbi:MAG: cysteinyl-tRNA synthetase, partial [Thermoleophilaceae bacterium]|nr:cysteinyl-tRNA synthetase [Thermoleophilaceae bacterium]
MSRSIQIQDTLSGAERELRPRDPGKVGIYACGPTVYAPVHVGNARPYVVFSLYKRFLEHEGYDANLVINITDVNDKIYDAAREAGVPSEQLAAEMSERYKRDTSALGLGRPDAEPLASETIQPIVDLIEALIDSGNAYAAGGDVYFDVATFPEYGKLSNRPVEEMEQGEDDDTGLKRHRQDFALWKAHKEGEDTYWESPWGRGRPGWHIECSAMAEQYLGVDFDVHGGGSDLIFPHHENEIAQTEAARHEPLARLWMHNGMLQFGDEKMSKSVGNIRTLAGALEEYGRDALVMYFAQSHYRKPVEFSQAMLEQASRGLERVRDLVRRLSGGEEPAAIEPYA